MTYRELGEAGDAGMRGTRLCVGCGAAAIEVEEHHFHCAACGGAWLDAGFRPQDARALEGGSRFQAAGRAARGCPICDEPLAPACLGSTMVETCAAHGTFFAAGRLARVAAVLGAEHEAAPNASRAVAKPPFAVDGMVLTRFGAFSPIWLASAAVVVALALLGH